MSDDGWTMEEAGWYTHEKYGGICQGRWSWCWYPPGSGEFPRMRYSTLSAAKIGAKLSYEAERASDD